MQTAPVVDYHGVTFLRESDLDWLRLRQEFIDVVKHPRGYARSGAQVNAVPT